VDGSWRGGLLERIDEQNLRAYRRGRTDASGPEIRWHDHCGYGSGYGDLGGGGGDGGGGDGPGGGGDG